MRNFNERSKPNSFALACAIILLSCGAALAQTTSFTYQGRLTDGGAPANGSYDLQFALFDNSSGGAQIGSTQTIASVSVGGGVFTVQLDFGVNAFPGANRFLEIGVRPAGVGSFTVLSPRQQISSTPYAIRTLSAATADTAANATQLGGVAASQYVQTTDARLSDARAPTAGSSNYIQSNPAAQQSGASFNISGSGTAGGTLSGNVVNSATQFNIGGNRVLSVAGTNNVFAGPSAGQANTSGSGNAFVGAGAGQANTVGINNSFFGLNAGSGNVGFISQFSGQVTTGKNNSFFGVNAGKLLPQSTDNSFFGANAGGSSTLGDQNSFFGSSTGSASRGDANSFFGVSAGAGNNGSRNSFFGVDAGAVGNGGAASGDDNAFFGTFAGENNRASGNSFFGSGAGMATTTGGTNAFFGYQAGMNNVGGNDNTYFGYQAGRSGNDFGNSFFGVYAGLSSNATNNSFFGRQAGKQTTSGFQNSFFGFSSGLNNVQGINNSFFGGVAGESNVGGSYNTIIGFSADVASGNLTNATAIGANARVAQSNSLVLGSINGVGDATADTSVGIGTTTPNIPARLTLAGSGAFNVAGAARFDLVNKRVNASFVQHVTDNAAWQLAVNTGTVRVLVDSSGNVGIGTPSPDRTLTVNGRAKIGSIPPEASAASVCFNAAGDLLQCGFSSLRFKTNVRPFLNGLDIIRRLRPISFDWKDGSGHDIGLGAEEVAQVAPSFIFTNSKGEITGVRYERLDIILINAVKEQQTEIEALRAQNAALDARLSALESHLVKRRGRR